jgi:beta-galactosidase
MELGVCYYPEQWHESYWFRDASRMVDMGISHVRIAEFAWSLIEPDPGRFDWAWLDRVIETLHSARLKIILCTPTATPPKWLIDQDPSMLAIDANGNPKRFGSRRHYCFSSENFRAQSRRITSAIVSRYGNHPAVVAWQTDNEYGCHSTVQSFSKSAHQHYRNWLAKRYGTVDKLNAAWGTAFWSQTYRSFDEIDPPMQAVTEAHPALRLDWRRFGSDEVVEFNREQIDIIRAGSPGRLVTHNFMGFFTEFDHYKVSQDLDVATLDSYPIGFTQMFFLNAQEKQTWAEVGHPDIPSFHYDLYRGMCKGGKWWVMEQQSGPVNWAHWNPIPKDGMVRLWTWQAMMHGCGLVSYFRWRQTPYAQEQMHAGLLTPDDSEAQGAVEVRQLANEIKALTGHVPLPHLIVKAQVALVFDYETMWMAEIQPQGADYNALEQVFRIYSVLRSLGLSVDIVSEDADLSSYSCIILAAQWNVSDQLLQQLSQSTAHIVVASRAGSKSAHMSIAEPMPPGALMQLAGVKVQRVGSMAPGSSVPLFAAGAAGAQHAIATGRRWIEDLQCVSATPWWINSQGKPIVTRHHQLTYVGTWLDDADWRNLLDTVCTQAGLSTQRLAEGLRISQWGPLTLAANYADTAVVWKPKAPAAQLQAQPQKILMGNTLIPPQGIAIWQVH